MSGWHHVQVETTIGTILSMTEGQRETLRAKIEGYERAKPYQVKKIQLWLGSMGLPDDYVGVVFTFQNPNGQLVGGIDPEGNMST